MNVYESLSRHFNVNLVAVTGWGGALESTVMNENFVVYKVPMTKAYYNLMTTEQKKAKGHLHDILLVDGYTLIPDLTGLCGSLASQTDVFISSHPYFFKMLLEYGAHKVIVYEAHNVDYELKKSYFEEDNEYSKKYLALVKSIEETACRRADFIMAVSEFDADELCKAYAVARDKVVLVPNGIDVFSCKYHGRKRGGGNVIFIGSAHGPNIEALKFIISKLAPKSTDITYTIVGNLKDTLNRRNLPANVKFTGIVDERTKENLYREMSVAINPMFSGSGTNLKVIEYAAFGLPLISTPFGMRGLDALKPHVFLADQENFLACIKKTLSLPLAELDKKTQAARKTCETYFDKSVIIENVVEKIATLKAPAEPIGKKTKIAIEGRILNRNITGTERYIAEILKNILLTYDSEKFEIGIVNYGDYNSDEVGFYSSCISLREGIDIYHRTYQTNNYFELMELLLAKKSVFTFHDLISCKYPEYFPNKTDYNRYVRCMKLALNFSDRIIAISESAKKDVIDTFGISKDKIDVVYHGLDFNKFRKIPDDQLQIFRREFSLPEKYLLYVGTDYPHKNLVNFFAAFAMIMDKDYMKDYYIVVAGNIFYTFGHDYLKEYIAPINKRLIRFPYFPDSKIAHLYNAAAMFVYPSLYEGFGFPVLEAFACETPLICSNASSLPEVAGEAAYMVDAREPVEIAEAIMDIVGNPSLRASLIEKGKRRVKMFSWEKCAKETFYVYKRALEGPVSCKAKDDEYLMTLLDGLLEDNLGGFPRSLIRRPSLLNPAYILSKLKRVRNPRDIKRLIAAAKDRIKRREI